MILSVIHNLKLFYTTKMSTSIIDAEYETIHKAFMKDSLIDLQEFYYEKNDRIGIICKIAVKYYFRRDMINWIKSIDICDLAECVSIWGTIECVDCMLDDKEFISPLFDACCCKRHIPKIRHMIENYDVSVKVEHIIMMTDMDNLDIIKLMKKQLKSDIVKFKHVIRANMIEHIKRFQPKNLDEIYYHLFNENLNIMS